jgi:predicted porin
LGGGWQANVLLESGFGADSGGGLSAFNLWSTVGVSGSLGAISLGLQPGPYFITAYEADPFAFSDYFSPMYLIGATDAQPKQQIPIGRPANLIRYRTPYTLGGFYAGLAYAPGESAVLNQHSGDILGGNIGWRAKGFSLGYAFQRQRSGSATAPVATPTTATFQVISGTYRVADPVQISFAYQRSALDLAGTPSAHVISLGAIYDVAPASQLKFSIARRRVDGTERGQLVWALGYDYWLSKRTSVYGRYLHQHNYSGAQGAFAGVPLVNSADNSGRNFGVGIRHSF